jgi:NADPH:quinone reductase-like Zn-dependent oxidoreductase
MANLAAVFVAPEKSLSIEELPMPTLGPHELLIAVSCVALNPSDYKLARESLFPLPGGFVIGRCFGGTVSAVGAAINSSDFAIGDFATGSRRFPSLEPKYGAFQRYVVVSAETTTKLAREEDIEVATALLGNLPPAVGLVREAGLELPPLDREKPLREKGKKILVYGGSSSLGSTIVQLVVQAGYEAVTTSSPKNHDFVSKLGATKVLNHCQDIGGLADELKQYGPYDVVIDAISTLQTLSITSAALNAQDNDNSEIYTTSGPVDKATLSTGIIAITCPRNLPEGFNPAFAGWSISVDYSEELRDWTYKKYINQALATGKLVSLQLEKIPLGLNGIEQAFDRMKEGTTGVKLILDPRE